MCAERRLRAYADTSADFLTVDPLGSKTATVLTVDVIPQKDLRNHIGEILRRVEAGENLTVTVAGRPVAELGPAKRRRWVSGAALARVWQGPPPRKLDADLARLDADRVDPFAP